MPPGASVMSIALHSRCDMIGTSRPVARLANSKALQTRAAGLGSIMDGARVTSVTIDCRVFIYGGLRVQSGHLGRMSNYHNGWS